MIISIIAAMTKHKRVIGLNNAMPWHLPADLAFFKKMTLNKPIIMGRNTFLSIGKALPNRQNIVVSRSILNKNDSSVEWVQSIDEGITFAKRNNASEVVVIGGGTIYQQTLPLATKLYLTYIDAELEGDTFFPNFTPSLWEPIFNECHDADEKNPYNYQFQILVKK